MPNEPKAKRLPGALEKNLVMSLAYCAKCKFPLGAGGMPTPPKHVDAKSGDIHVATVIPVDAAERIDLAAGETSEKFLARLMKKYVK